MYYQLTDAQLLAGGALLVLIFFTLAEFLDFRWRKAVSLCHPSSDHEPDSPPPSFGRTDKAGSSSLNTSIGDSSAHGLGAAEQRVTFRSKRIQEGIQSPPALPRPSLGEQKCTSIVTWLE
jgi:hypothetical protein